MSQTPVAVWPIKATCGLPLYAHNPRLEDLQMYCCKMSNSTLTPKKRVGFFQLVPKAQKCTTTEEVSLRFNKHLTAGQSHKRDRSGFSKVNGIRQNIANLKMRQLKYINVLPTRTLPASTSLKPSRPRGLSSDRSRGGPPGLSRAREKLLQGVPTWRCVLNLKSCHLAI